MASREIFRAFDKLPAAEIPDEPEEGGLNLRGFIEHYVASPALANIIRAFPRSNLDIKALEAHVWDRLRDFYRYDYFSDVNIESPEEIKFVNKGIELIEDWFYDGGWTSCLDTPSEEQIQKLLSGHEHGFLQTVRRTEPTAENRNLGRGVEPPIPNIYEDAASGRDLREVYFEHAFRFLHGPAAVLNTLTRIRSSSKDIKANSGKFQQLIESAYQHAIENLKSWGYEINNSTDPDVKAAIESRRIMAKMPDYIRQREEYKRNLFFLKTCMIAAELIRRTGDGRLTAEGFRNIMAWRKKEIEKERRRKPHQTPEDQKLPETTFPFDFANVNNLDNLGRSRSSVLHVNADELTMALFVVDFLRQRNEQNKGI
jgi:hypothetical protein